MRDETQRPNAMRFVIFQEDELWVAICLEHYVGAQGRTPDEVKRRLQIAYRAELDKSKARTGTPFGDIVSAPEKYRQMYESADVAVTRGEIWDMRGMPLALAA